MPQRSPTQAFLSVSLVGTALVSVTACFGSSACLPQHGQVPVHRVEFHVEHSAQSEFLRNLEAVAKSHEMDFRAAAVRPDGLHWIAEGVNQDLHVISANPLESESFYVSFYECTGKPFPQAAMNDFLAEISSGVRDVPGINLTRTKIDEAPQP